MLYVILGLVCLVVGGLLGGWYIMQHDEKAWVYREEQIKNEHNEEVKKKNRQIKILLGNQEEYESSIRNLKHQHKEDLQSKEADFKQKEVGYYNAYNSKIEEEKAKIYLEIEEIKRQFSIKEQEYLKNLDKKDYKIKILTDSFDERVDKRLLHLVQNSHLIPRYIHQMYKRGFLQMQERQEAIRKTENLQALEDKSLNLRNEMILSREDKLAFQTEKKTFEIARQGFELSKKLSSFETEKEKWSLKIEKQKIEDYNTKVQLFVKEKQLELDKREQYFIMMQQQGKIDADKQLLQIEKDRNNLELKAREIEFSRREIEEIARQEDNILAEKKLEYKKQVLTAFIDQYIYKNPIEVDQAFNNFGYQIESPMLEIAQENGDLLAEISYERNKNVDLENRNADLEKKLARLLPKSRN